MQMMLRRSLALLPLLLPATDCFSPGSALPPKPRPPSKLDAIDHALALEMGAARGAFALCFYGAAGVGSIGRELIPIVFGRYKANLDDSANAGATASRGGGGRPLTDLGVNGYPEPIYLEDVQPILANRMSAEAIANKYKAEDVSGPRFEYTHIERTPFLTYDAFRLANPGANPIALRAVFDSFSVSIGGGNAVSPITAQEKIDMYRQDVTAMTKKLNNSKLLGVSAFVLVLVLLGFADYLAIYHLWKGFFPEWQGFSDMPSSLFDRDIGIFALSDNFVWEIPDV